MTMIVLAGIGLKSLLTAGITLALLYLLRHRSAAERSLVGHAGIAATLLLPVLVLAGLQWPVAPPAAVAWIEPAVAMQAPASAAYPALEAATTAAEASAWMNPELLALLLYGIPAALLLLTTLVAVLRLFAIRARAAVLIEPHWLAALAHAQRRMGFKNGAALLTSDELGSPVSWGLFRPTIVLNRDAAGSAADAEAIIAHELAHVVRRDWLNLLAGRTATALFWCNPLVWLLARQCHQLREEAADDAVLASDVAGADYAQLLVGAARHESRGTLLAANGVAPGRNSLKRRVTRVLDASLSRRPGGIGWRAGCALVAVAVSAPLAALTPAGPLPVPPLAAARPPAAPVPALAREKAAAAAAVTEGELDLRIDAVADGIEARAGEVDRAIAQVQRAVGAAEGAGPVEGRRVDRLAFSPFSRIEAIGGVHVTLRPGAGYFASSPGGGVDPNRFERSGDTLIVRPCTTDCESAGNSIELVLPAVDAVALQGGGAVVAAPGFPRTRNIAVAILGGGEIDIRNIPADSATAAVNAGGTIRVRPDRALSGAVRAGGEILYWGEPAVTRAISDGGSIRRGGGT